jgi:hypothetical protein
MGSSLIVAVTTDYLKCSSGTDYVNLCFTKWVLVFFFWQMSSDFFVKNYVYLVKIGNRAHSEERIQEAAEPLLRNVLQRAWLEVEYLLDVCRERHCRCTRGNLVFNFVLSLH